MVVLVLYIALISTKEESYLSLQIIMIKCVVVGDGAVGKTCLLIRYSKNSYDDSYIPTVFDQYNANVTVDNKPVTLNLWDTAGQDDYDRLRPLSYPNTDVFIICFCVHKRSSYDNVLNKWYPEIKNATNQPRIILVATQIDRRRTGSAGDAITPEQGKSLAKSIHAIRYLECSALSNEGVKEIFDAAIRAVLEPKEKRPSKGFCSVL